MLKYCNGCKRDLEIDNFYSYKKSICKECVNKKVKCDYCNKEFNSTNLSKHIKQRHSTYDSTNNSTSNNSTSNKTYKNNSTSNKTYKNNSTSNSNSEITISDQLYVHKYLDLLQSNKINFDIKNTNKINKILARNKILINKIEKDSLNQKEKTQFANNLKKLKDLNYFDEKICSILLKSIQ